MPYFMLLQCVIVEGVIQVYTHYTNIRAKAMIKLDPYLEVKKDNLSEMRFFERML